STLSTACKRRNKAPRDSLLREPVARAVDSGSARLPLHLRTGALLAFDAGRIRHRLAGPCRLAEALEYEKRFDARKGDTHEKSTLARDSHAQPLTGIAPHRCARDRAGRAATHRRGG